MEGLIVLANEFYDRNGTLRERVTTSAHYR
jgi:hypothetical protein